MGRQEHPKQCGVAYSGTGALEVSFLAKMTKMPLVNPKLDRRTNEVETLTKRNFS